MPLPSPLQLGAKAIAQILNEGPFLSRSAADSAPLPDVVAAATAALLRSPPLARQHLANGFHRGQTAAGLACARTRARTREAAPQQRGRRTVVALIKLYVESPII